MSTKNKLPFSLDLNAMFEFFMQALFLQFNGLLRKRNPKKKFTAKNSIAEEYIYKASRKNGFDLDRGSEFGTKWIYFIDKVEVMSILIYNKYESSGLTNVETIISKEEEVCVFLRCFRDSGEERDVDVILKDLPIAVLEQEWFQALVASWMFDPNPKVPENLVAPVCKVHHLTTDQYERYIV